jgi:4-amino-4-deoxy-L-arabinose transferase-like glycosyltransferase
VKSGVVRAHPLLVVLGGVVTLAFVYQLFLVLATPPNNGDAMKYHLSRAVTWLHHGGLDYIGGRVSRGVEFQPNAEIGILYTFAFLKRDTAAALPQLLAEVALVVGIAGSARRLGFTRSSSLFGALLGASLTQIALQSVTVKNDLVLASFVVAAAYFLQGAVPIELALAGLAIGLAFGTKLTALLVLPSLALIAVVSLPRGRILFATGAAVAGFAALGAFSYLQNVIETGGPLGSRPEENIFKPDVTFRGTVSTVARITYKFIDFSGFRVRTNWLDPISNGGEHVFSALRIPPNPPESQGFPFTFTINVISDVDHSFFGPLGFLLVLPLVVCFGVGWLLGRTSPIRGAFAAALPLSALAVALTFRFSDESRYFIAPVAMTLALSAAVYPRRWLAWPTAGLAAATLVFAHAYNVAKPTGLGGTEPVWRLSRAEAEGLTLRGMPAAIAGVDRLVPARARLGTLLGGSDWDYPLYGPRLQRRLVPLPRVAAIRTAEGRHLRWIFVGRTVRAPAVTPGWREIRFSKAGALLLRIGHLH